MSKWRHKFTQYFLGLGSVIVKLGETVCLRVPMR